MATSVVMPALEMAQETGRLLNWRKNEGDAVRKGDVLMDVETDKAAVEIEATADGVLAAVSARDGDVVRVGETMAWIVGPGESAPVPAPPSADVQVTRPMTGPSLAASVVAAPVFAARPGMSPKARRLAAERMKATAVDTPTAEVPDTTWQMMADRMVTSWTTVPHFFLTCDVDASALQAARERRTAEGANVTFTDCLVSLIARTLVQHPRLNASWDEGTIRFNDHVHVGVATAVAHGVVVPVIRDADSSTLADIAHQRHELVERARARRSRLDDVKGATFTLSNLGMYNVHAFTAIVNPPQAAILAVGRIADRVVAVQGQPVVLPMMTLTLSSDHRVTDGARSAAFLDALVHAIQDPEPLLS